MDRQSLNVQLSETYLGGSPRVVKPASEWEPLGGLTMFEWGQRSLASAEVK